MYWACAQIEPYRERLAMHCLGLNGFEIYCPRLRQQVHSRGRKIIRTPLLFPGYVFVLVVSAWWSARWSPGVRRLVMDGEQPARVADAVIAEIRSREVGGLVELPKRGQFKPGDQLKVMQGPFAGHVGLYAGMRAHERILVLLALLGSQQRVELPVAAVEPVRY
jgi:transcriptional antiterminator RfaH